MEQQAVPDFVDPVHAPERQATEHHRPLSRADLLRIDVQDQQQQGDDVPREVAGIAQDAERACGGVGRYHGSPGRTTITRSEEHTSELQSLMRISYAVFCLKKKNKRDTRRL